MEINDFAVRRAVGSDAADVAEVWLRSFTAALPSVRRAHTDDEVLSWFREVVVPDQETWVATVADSVVAMMVLDGEDLGQLYLDPVWQGQGIGGRLVDLAKQRRPAGLTLWTFQVNESARRFYERHGFVAGECTDGHRNEEREPDVRYVWRPGEAGRVHR
ncbi:GNAT family N-acetyltransferase [Streptomyces sp. NPDC049813]|uniref:GNAT family N-acetyltransferase n=1 Tax=Streptomyces sp. NPDC049813 TaxID=3365597 RepID=UPI00378E622E